MDILQPELIWIEDRCYRFCDSITWSSEQSNSPYQEDYCQQEEQDSMNNICDDDIQVVSMSNGSYQHTFYVPRDFYGFIIGKKGLMKKKIETETNTTFTVPKVDSKNEDIKIIGSTQGNVISCRRRLDLLIESCRNKIRYTHFVSIPLNTETLMANYEKFKKNIVDNPECKSKGIHEELFVDPCKLHLTIGMLRLLSEKEKNDAIETLSNCVKEIIEPILLKIKKPLSFEIQGLNYMNDDPSKISVLYAETKNDYLQDIANKTFKYFLERDLMSVEYSEHVNLHMTLMKMSRLSKIQKRPKKFDVTEILKEYKDYFFGEVTLKSINISQIGVTEPDGHYKRIKEINLDS